ncbi:uncharacterized protein M6B38_187730 [Iris pallida]|uniref:Uncharacterized protein n=1 Tax=Iris pallida TaxID=29817 RepID=A0AAX6EIR5_IRIPA|nr:Uncharacterized protein M6B38_219990 [Iris pallida]KAJ6803841.1 uncharacterized protein M6B38_187730 [Iris pallida]
MEKELKRPLRAPETDFLLQWGSRKRLRCVKTRDDSVAAAASPGRSDGQRRTASHVGRRGVRVGGGGGENRDKDFRAPSPLLTSPIASHRKLETAGSGNKKSRSVSLSPEKEDRFYTTRWSVIEDKENGNGLGIIGEERGGTTILPRFFVSLSNKEKEEDFMAMKGCKLPQRPRKRPKFLQKSILLVCPGAWLTDLSHERYEVREKKSSRKKKRGLKAMCLESDSE